MNYQFKSTRTFLTKLVFKPAYFLIFVLGVIAVGQTNVPDASELGRMLVEAPLIASDSIAPDGRAIVYAVSRPSVETNSLTHQLLLQKLRPGGEPVGQPKEIANSTGDYAARFGPRWCPDSRSFIYVGKDPGDQKGGTALLRFDIDSGKVSTFPIQPFTVKSTGVGKLPQITKVPVGSTWSPKGNYLAFTSSLLPSTVYDPRKGVNSTPFIPGNGPSQPASALFTLDVHTGQVEQLTDDTMYVLRFDWSPDEQSLVVESGTFTPGKIARDLYVVERSTQRVKPLVVSDAFELGPKWSPDGKWIVFSRNPEPSYLGHGWPAIVSADGGPVTILADGDDEICTQGSLGWSPDSRAVRWTQSWDLAQRILTVEIGTKKVAPLHQRKGGADQVGGFSDDGRIMAFTRESATEPAELYTKNLASGAEHKITLVTPPLPFANLIRSERVSWRSKDGKFDIHAILLTPRNAWADDTSKKPKNGPLPTTVFLHGGPGMVRDRFKVADGINGATLALAARGYAVLVPNTRGRSGYGAAFWRGMRDGGSAGRLPFEDMMGGVDLLVKSGIADANKLGVVGHSYGGYMTTYAIAHTDRFKAAVVHEPNLVNMYESALSLPPVAWFNLMIRDLYGIGDPSDPKERERLIDETPILNVHRVTTPTLYSVGAKASEEAVRPLYGGLVWRGIPSEFVVFDEGHVTFMPVAGVDEVTRYNNWFDYWLRDMPYPDKERQKEYDAWKAKNIGRWPVVGGQKKAAKSP